MIDNHLAPSLEKVKIVLGKSSMLTSAPQSRSHLQNIHKPSADMCRVEMKNQILQDMSVFLNIFK